uniref:serine/threonine/tyrosine-interacting-like protein 2 isoform X3 n=1 Tax=Myxine glutinosa TaxID=7769 RepID=UPI00358F7C3B
MDQAVSLFLLAMEMGNQRVGGIEEELDRGSERWQEEREQMDLEDEDGVQNSSDEDESVQTESSNISCAYESDTESFHLEPINLSPSLVANRILQLGKRKPQLHLVQHPLETPEELMVEDLFQHACTLGASSAKFGTPSVLALQRALRLGCRKMPHNSADEVWPQVYISDKSVAMNRGRMKRFGITHVINTAHETGIFLDEAYFETSGFRCLGIPADDFVNYDLKPHFHPVADFIDEALLTDKGTVLIASVMGESRPAALVAAYLMIYHRLPLLDALLTINKHRPIAPNDGFLKQLRDLNDTLMEEWQETTEPNGHGTEEHNNQEAIMLTNGSMTSLNDEDHQNLKSVNFANGECHPLEEKVGMKEGIERRSDERKNGSLQTSLAEKEAIRSKRELKETVLAWRDQIPEVGESDNDSSLSWKRAVDPEGNPQACEKSDNDGDNRTDSWITENSYEDDDGNNDNNSMFDDDDDALSTSTAPSFYNGPRHDAGLTVLQRWRLKRRELERKNIAFEKDFPPLRRSSNSSSANSECKECGSELKTESEVGSKIRSGAESQCSSSFRPNLQAYQQWKLKHALCAGLDATDEVLAMNGTLNERKWRQRKVAREMLSEELARKVHETNANQEEESVHSEQYCQSMSYEGKESMNWDNRSTSSSSSIRPRFVTARTGVASRMMTPQTTGRKQMSTAPDINMKESNVSRQRDRHNKWRMDQVREEDTEPVTRSLDARLSGLFSGEIDLAKISHRAREKQNDISGVMTNYAEQRVRLQNHVRHRVRSNMMTQGDKQDHDKNGDRDQKVPGCENTAELLKFVEGLSCQAKGIQRELVGKGRKQKARNGEGQTTRHGTAMAERFQEKDIPKERD